MDKVWYFNNKNISISEKIQVTLNPDQTDNALSSNWLGHHSFKVEIRNHTPLGRHIHKLNQEKYKLTTCGENDCFFKSFLEPKVILL